MKNILLIVQNNSFPFDKRVLREAVTLKQNGNNVFVISPMSAHDTEKNTTHEGIKIIRYKDLLAKGKIRDYFFEYLNALIRIFFLTIKIIFKNKIDIVHIANPPDFFWPLAILCKVFGVKFIYDQHDLAPEMSHSKFQSNLIYKLLLINEKLSVKFADAIIVVNKTFKQRLIEKWNINPDKCIVVYNGPPKEFMPIKNDELINQYIDKKIVLYIGLMTVNDHIEVIINVANELINKRGKNNIHFILVGDGDVRKQMEELSNSYNLDNKIEFTGIVDHKRVREFLHLADVCVAPDLPNGLNEHLTLVKVLEYMKCSKAFVAFKLKETMDFSGEAGLYADNDFDFADKIELLLDNPDLEKEMGVKGNKIINDNYLWSHSEKVLLELYHSI